MGAAVAPDGGRDQRARPGSRARRPTMLVAELLELATIAREHHGRSRSRRRAAPPGARRDADARGGARALRRSLPRAPRLARPHRPLRVRARQRARGRRRARRPRAPARGDRAARRAPPRRHPARDRRVAADRRARAGLAEGRRGAAPADRARQDVGAARASASRPRSPPPAIRSRACTRSRRWRRRIASARSSRAARSSSTSRSSPRTPTTTRRSRRSPSSTSARATTPGSRTRCAACSISTRSARAPMARAGRPADAPKEWPVAKRSERLTDAAPARAASTRRGSPTSTASSYACGAVLELLTGDRDALERMERVLEKANDPRLEQTLEYHAAASTSPAERAKLLKRLAKLATEREDDVAALERWEQTLRASPSRSRRARRARGALRARRALARARAGPRAPRRRPPAARAGHARGRDPRARARALRDRRSTARCNDPARAIKAWHRVLELIAEEPHRARRARAGCTARARKWRELAEILGRQIAGARRLDDRRRSRQARRGRDGARRDPRGAPRRAGRRDQGARRAAPRASTRTTSTRTPRCAGCTRRAATSTPRCASPSARCTCRPSRCGRSSRGLEIGFICRDRLGNPTRALQAFKRVLELDPEQDEALAAAADLLAQARPLEGARRDARAHARRVPAATSEAPALAEERRDARPADRRGDRRQARRSEGRVPLVAARARRGARRADARRRAPRRRGVRPVARARRGAHRRAQAAGRGRRRRARRARALRRAVARARAAVPSAGSATSRARSRCSPRRSPSRRATPSLLAELERLAAELDQRTAVEGAARRVRRSRSPPRRPRERVELYLRRARILDERVGDPQGRGRRRARRVLVGARSRRHRATRSYALAAEGTRVERRRRRRQRADRARARRPRSASSCCAARPQTIEEQLKDAPRAFRTHLIALLLAPDDADTASHLWRLARVIGKYRDADQHAARRAAVGDDPDRAGDRRGASRPRLAPRPVAPRIPRRAQTEPLDDDRRAHPQRRRLDAAARSRPRSRCAARRARSRATGDEPRSTTPRTATMTLSPSDIATMAVPPTRRRAAACVAAAPAAGVAPRPARRKLPPPPPRPPQITAAHARAPRRCRPPMRAQGAGAGAPAAAADAAEPRVRVAVGRARGRVRERCPRPTPARGCAGCIRAAEVWETGGKDIARAFDALARAFAQARARAAKATPRSARACIASRSEHKAWDRLADLYEGMAEQAETAHAAADLLMEVATIRCEQKRPREAEAQLRRILGMLPNDVTARARLEELYRGEGRWVELAASLEERTDPRLGTAAPEAERPQLLRELAAIYTDKLNRPHDAIDAFERLRVLAPADTGVLLQLADLYGTVGRWSKVIETLARSARSPRARDEARDALRQIAQIYEQELELPERAIESYEQLVATWPDDAEAWAALDRLYQAHARWTELADVLRRRAALAREPRRARAAARAPRAACCSTGSTRPRRPPRRCATRARSRPTIRALADQLVDRARQGRPRARGRRRSSRTGIDAAIDAQRRDRRPQRRPRRAPHPARAAPARAARRPRRRARARSTHALALVPEHPTALAVLAQLASPDEDPRAFADAKLREADSAQRRGRQDRGADGRRRRAAASASAISTAAHGRVRARARAAPVSRRRDVGARRPRREGRRSRGRDARAREASSRTSR